MWRSNTVAEWLAPFLTGKTKLSEIGADDLGGALDALLPWQFKRRLEEEAPTHFAAPTGNRHAIDYETSGAPALHIRVQELFGVTQHPSIAHGRLPLTLHLALAGPPTEFKSHATFPASRRDRGRRLNPR